MSAPNDFDSHCGCTGRAIVVQAGIVGYSLLCFLLGVPIALLIRSVF